MLAKIQKRVSKTIKRAADAIGGHVPPLKLLRQALLNGDDYQACQIFTVSGRQSESNVDTKLQELGLEMFDDRNSSGYNPDASPSSSANYSGNREEITNLYEYLDPSAYFPYVRCGDTTPLHLACETACPNILQLFLEHGANPNVTNERGETALHVLCSRPENSDQRLMMLDMLVKWEYDGRLVRNISSNTPLSAPGEKLSLNRVDKYGNSALHFAASNGLIDIVRRLIELGAIVSIVNKNNQSCCDLSDCYPEYNSISNMLEIALVYSPLTEDELLIQQFEENDHDRSDGDADVSCNGFDLEQATKYTSVSGLSKVLVGPQLFYQHESHIQLYNRMDVVLSHNRSLHACEVQDNMLTIDTTCVMTLVQIEQYMQIATWMVCDITGLHSTRAEWLCAKYNWNIKQLLLDLYYHLDHVLQIAKMPTHITAREMILSCNQISSNYVKRLIASTVEKESTEENECELCEFNKIRTNVVRPVLSLPSTASVTYTAHLLSKRGAGKLAQKEQIPVDQEVEASMEAFDAEIFEDSEEEGVCEGNETENLKVSCGAKNVAPLDISFESSYEPMANYRSERSLNQRSDGIASQAEKNKANMLASSWFLCLEEYRECVLEFRPIVKNQSEETDAPIEDIASAKSDSRVISLSNSLVSTSTEDGDGKGEVYEQHDTVDHTVAMDSALVKSTVNDLVYSVSIGSSMVVSSRVPDATVVISSVASGATGTLSPTHSSTIVAHETPIKTEADATPPPNPWDYSCGICGDDLDLIVNSDVQQQWKKMLILKLEVIAQCDHLNKHVEGCNSSMNDTLLSCMDKEIIKYCNVFDKLSALLHSNDESVVFDELSSIADPVVGIRCGNACGVNTRLGHCAKEFDNVEEHLYCTTCWQGYFDMRVKEGAGGGSGGVGCVLQCPGYQCSESLDFDWFSELFYPSEVKLDGDGCTDTRDGIDRGLSSSLHQSVQKLLHTRLNQVVDSCDAFRWCPREDTCAGLVLCTDSFPMLLLSNYHHLTLTTSLFDPKFQALGLSNAMEPGGNMDSKSDVLPRHQIRTGLMRTLTSALSVSSPPHSFSNSNFMQYAPFQQRLEGTLLDLILNNKPSSLADPANAELTNAVKAVSATWPKTVLCDNHHSLCLSCSEEGHSPCTCVEWKKWRTKIGSALQATSSNKDGVVTTNSDELANALWVAANTKKCPRCSLPIEKDDGCNHMNCRKCKHEFCWICMQDWSLHSQDTGGYFQCNRFVENVQSASGRDGEEDDEDELEGLGLGSGGGAPVASGDSREEGQRMKEKGNAMARFIHHFSRYSAHSDSLAKESALKIDSIHRLRDSLLWCSKQPAVVVNSSDGMEVKDSRLGLIYDIKGHWSLSGESKGMGSDSNVSSLLDKENTHNSGSEHSNTSTVNRHKKTRSSLNVFATAVLSKVGLSVTQKRNRNMTTPAKQKHPQVSTPSTTASGAVHTPMSVNLTPSTVRNSFDGNHALYMLNDPAPPNIPHSIGELKLHYQCTDVGNISSDHPGLDNQCQWLYSRAQQAHPLDNLLLDPIRAMVDTCKQNCCPSDCNLAVRSEFDLDVQHHPAIEFLINGFDELFKCRQVLRSSYAHAYFEFRNVSQSKVRTLNRKRGYAGNSAKNRKALQEEYDLLISLSRHKELFENLQAELEQSTEILSDVVARSRLRATKLNIIAATKRASNNRKRLEKCVYNYWKDKATSTLQASLNPSADGDAPSSRNNAQSFDGDYSFRWGSRMPSRNRYNHSRSRMDPEAAAGISTGNDYMQGILDRSGYFGGVGRNRSRGTPDLYDPGLGLGLNMGFGLDDDDDDFDIAAALNLIEAQHMNQSHRNEIGSDNNASVPDRMSEAEVVGDSAGIAEHSMSESVADTVNTPPPVPRTGLIPHHNPRTAQHTPGISNLPPIPANIRNNMDPPTPPTSRSGGPERSDDTSNITPISATTTPTVRERRNRSDSNRLNMRMRQISLRLEEEEGLNRAIMMSFHDAVPSGESTGSILSPTPPSSDHVELLVAMGFNRQIAVEALRDANNNIEIATDRLLGST